MAGSRHSPSPPTINTRPSCTPQSHALALRVIAYRFHRHVRTKLVHLLTGVHLTGRERQCLALAKQGKPFPDIGLILGISPRTVKDYIDSAKVKFGVRTAREAAALFVPFSTGIHPVVRPRD